MKKTIICIMAIVLCISLFTGCGAEDVSGSYVAENGDAYDFNGYGEVSVTQDGETVNAYTYAVDGSDIYVYEPDYNHESGETDHILTASGKTLTDKDGKVFTKVE